MISIYELFPSLNTGIWKTFESSWTITDLLYKKVDGFVKTYLCSTQKMFIHRITTVASGKLNAVIKRC
jgi:hypothetical protein